ncbi:MAG: NADH-quinone oxidoreductase subunit G [Gammaproteobacteria bacterium]|nr:NADH-quinone oxidoreductase subunit G [Gammaproteobacteria bacterium]
MNQDKCTIEINGVEVEARPGQMLIEVTDAHDVYVPRFCYHPKLSVAANCRMCLIEVENVPKPLPACATPVAPGMKVRTRSRRAIDAQRSVMEFLLINHPLDCPICDQGGECELQDLAMGFGRDVGRFSEGKRVVRDQDMGPLVSTDLTRCIHCTRCVRFTQEVAGIQELGTIGRGDRVVISSSIEQSISQTVDHELSGNLIDVCPVGSLNSKPYRFSARAWEMQQRALVAGHDCLGSHIFAHVMDGRVKRVVPDACENINETWASDRDRFSYEGLYADDRLDAPLLRENGNWRSVSWPEALAAAAAGLQERAGQGLAALVSPSATLEEGYLLQRLMAHLGSNSIDHRLRRRDVRGQADEPGVPWLGMPVAAVEKLDQLLIVGSNLRKEVPLLAHRVRKAAVAGAGIGFINPADFPVFFPVASTMTGSPDDFWLALATLVRAAAGDGELPAGMAGLLAQAPEPQAHHHQLVARLRDGTRAAIFLGQIAQRHPRFADIDVLAATLARLTGASLGYISEGANAVGLALAGVLPHRGPGGKPRATPGASACEIIGSPPPGLLLFGIEPEFDCAAGSGPARSAGDGRFVVACSAYGSESLLAMADVILPIATWFETEGTFVNAAGRWQSFAAAARAPGEGRPGWKVLRVLAEQLGAKGFRYPDAGAIASELRGLCSDGLPDALAHARLPVAQAPVAGSIGLSELDVPIYRIDALVRRATALQQTVDGRAGAPPAAAQGA